MDFIFGVIWSKRLSDSKLSESGDGMIFNGSSIQAEFSPLQTNLNKDKNFRTKNLKQIF